MVKLQKEQEATEQEEIEIITNPSAPGYPRAGDLIDIQDYSHPFLGDNPGFYIVDKVIEYIPPGYLTDEDGRDIRIFLAGNKNDPRFRVAWNGRSIRDHSRIVGSMPSWASYYEEE